MMAEEKARLQQDTLTDVMRQRHNQENEGTNLDNVTVVWRNASSTNLIHT